MCLFKNSYVEALNTQCVFRKELKTGPRDGISALIKEIPESLLSLHVRIPGKGYVKHRSRPALCKSGREPSLEAVPYWTLVLDFLASRTVRKSISVA